MRKIIKKSYLSAEEKNILYEEGFRYLVEGNYRCTSMIDPRSGMPDTTHDIFAFTDKTEAEAFAIKQKWIFNKEIHADVKQIPEHSKTATEIQEEKAKKVAEKKAKKEANEAAKATAAGMTIAEYRAERKRIALAKRLTREIAELEAELNRKRALLKTLED